MNSAPPFKFQISNFQLAVDSHHSRHIRFADHFLPLCNILRHPYRNGHRASRDRSGIRTELVPFSSKPVRVKLFWHPLMNRYVFVDNLAGFKKTQNNKVLLMLPHLFKQHVSLFVRNPRRIRSGHPLIGTSDLIAPGPPRHPIHCSQILPLMPLHRSAPRLRKQKDRGPDSRKDHQPNNNPLPHNTYWEHSYQIASSLFAPLCVFCGKAFLRVSPPLPPFPPVKNRGLGASLRFLRPSAFPSFSTQHS
jgi:hypothetical protein